MFRKLFSWFLGLFASSDVSDEPVTPTHPADRLHQPNFYFADTMPRWRDAVLQLVQELDHQAELHAEEFDAFDSRWQELMRQQPSGTGPQAELERRRICGELEELGREEVRIGDRYRAVQKKLGNPESVSSRFEKMERNRIAHEGKVITQSFRNRQRGYPVVRDERRLVLLEDGRHFVCSISYVSEEDEGCVDWVTDSLSQYTNDELEAIAKLEVEQAAAQA